MPVTGPFPLFTLDAPPDPDLLRREVNLSGELWVLPEGTTYGGGPRTWRDPAAPPVDQTPIRSLDAVLKEVGCIGTALDWARRHNLAWLREPERREHGDSEPLMMDFVEWDAGMTFTQWRVFAHLYQIDLDAHGYPDGLDRDADDVELWRDLVDAMGFNIGGVTRVDHATLEVSYGPVPGRCACTGEVPRPGTPITCELYGEPFIVGTEGYVVREQHMAGTGGPWFDLLRVGDNSSVTANGSGFSAAPTEAQIVRAVADAEARATAVRAAEARAAEAASA